MTLALTPADQHALTVHTQQLLTLLDEGVVQRGQITAWLLRCADLVQGPAERAAQEARLAALLAATPRRGRRRPTVQRVETGNGRRGTAR